jgi:dephospho-CoA kinase
MPFIGLTGGIGTGKTTVLNYFKNLGAFTLNADSIVQ